MEKITHSKIRSAIIEYWLEIVAFFIAFVAIQSFAWEIEYPLLLCGVVLVLLFRPKINIMSWVTLFLFLAMVVTAALGEAVASTLAAYAFVSLGVTTAIMIFEPKNK